MKDRFRADQSARAAALTVGIVAMAIAAAAGGAYLLVDVSHELREGTRENADPVTRTPNKAPTIQSAYVATSGGDGQELVLFATLEPPGETLDLMTLSFEVDVEGDRSAYEWSQATHSAERDHDGSLDANPPVLGRSDLAQIRLPLDGSWDVRGADRLEVHLHVPGDDRVHSLVVPAAPDANGLVALDVRL